MLSFCVRQILTLPCERLNRNRDSSDQATFLWFSTQYHPQYQLATHTSDGAPVGKHPLITHLIRGTRRLRPPVRGNISSWDLVIVHEGLVETPFWATSKSHYFTKENWRECFPMASSSEVIQSKVLVVFSTTGQANMFSHIATRAASRSEMFPVELKSVVMQF